MRCQRWKSFAVFMAFVGGCLLFPTNPCAQVLKGSEPLTNGDVIRMVEAQLPESTIIASIRSSASKFDLSADALVALHKAGVDDRVLEEMMAKNRAPSGARGSAITDKEAKLAAKMGPPKTGPKIRNPRAAEFSAHAIEVLEKQRNATDIEASQMKLGIRPQAQGGMLAGQSHSSITDGTRTQLPASNPLLADGSQPQPAAVQTQSQPMLAPGNSNAPATTPQATPARTAVQASPVLRTQPVGAIGPEQTSSAVTRPQAANAVSTQVPSQTIAAGTGAGTPNKIPPSLAELHPIDTTVLTCANNPAFRILSVGGSSFPATFTPIDQYNLYTIKGCSFGNPGPNDKVYIYGTGTFQANFVIKFWSDNSIALSLDSAVSGFPDLDNLTLVVQRNDGQQTQEGGFKFYAARDTVLLKAIPQSWATLAAVPMNFGTVPVQYFSPPGSDTDPFLDPSAKSTSAYVSRYYNGKKADPTGQSDYYDFSHLAEGWTTESFQLTTYAATCPFTVTYSQSFGTWSGDWDGNNIRVGLSDTTCSSFNPIMPLQNWQNITQSYYGLNVWVTGPRGTDPLTGAPTH